MYSTKVVKVCFSLKNILFKTNFASVKCAYNLGSRAQIIRHFALKLYFLVSWALTQQGSMGFDQKSALFYSNLL